MTNKSIEEELNITLMRLRGWHKSLEVIIKEIEGDVFALDDLTARMEQERLNQAKTLDALTLQDLESSN